MKPGMKIVIILITAVLFWGGMLVACVSCSEKPNNLAVKVAEKALMATVDHPESVKILGISKVDSVFGKNYVTMEEKMALSVMMMKINEQVMKATNNFEDFNPDNREMNELVERQMEAMTTLRALVAFGDIQPEVHGQKKPQAPFSGWKVKVEVEAPNAEGKLCRSEHWFILDMSAQFVVKSFKIPLL